MPENNFDVCTVAAEKGGAVVQRVGYLDFAISRSRVQILLEATLRNNLGQVVHTYVPLSPSTKSIRSVKTEW